MITAGIITALLLALLLALPLVVGGVSVALLLRSLSAATGPDGDAGTWVMFGGALLLGLVAAAPLAPLLTPVSAAAVLVVLLVSAARVRRTQAGPAPLASSAQP